MQLKAEKLRIVTNPARTDGKPGFLRGAIAFLDCRRVDMKDLQVDEMLRGERRPVTLKSPLFPDRAAAEAWGEYMSQSMAGGM